VEVKVCNEPIAVIPQFCSSYRISYRFFRQHCPDCFVRRIAKPQPEANVCGIRLMRSFRRRLGGCPVTNQVICLLF